MMNSSSRCMCVCVNVYAIDFSIGCVCPDSIFPVLTPFSLKMALSAIFPLLSFLKQHNTYIKFRCYFILFQFVLRTFFHCYGLIAPFFPQTQWKLKNRSKNFIKWWKHWILYGIKIWFFFLFHCPIVDITNKSAKRKKNYV